MAATKSSFLDKVLARIGRLDPEGLQTVVQRLARERSFLETLFNTIEDGVLVVDEQGRIVYFNLAVTNLLGLKAQDAEGQPVRRYLPDLNWKELSARDRAGGQQIVRHEFEVHYPRHRFLRLYAAPLDGEATGSSGMALILHDATEARQKTHEAIESERIQALTASQFAIELDAHTILGGKTRSHFVQAQLGRGNDRLALLMEQRWKEKEARMLRFETSASFAEAALAQNQDLLAAPQRVHHDPPFFEGHPHPAS